MLHFNHLESGRADHLQQLVKSQVHDGILVPLQRPAVQPKATRLQRRVDGCDRVLDVVHSVDEEARHHCIIERQAP